MMIRKWLAVGIVLLFIGMVIIPSTTQNIEKSVPPSRGHWFYVGGSGPGNYTTIRDAIDNASDGDTVYVFQGTYYYMGYINNSINLIGENRDTTIIGIREPFTIFWVFADNFHINNFTLWNYGKATLPKISIYSDSCIIENMRFMGEPETASQSLGEIYLISANNTIIRNNFFNYPPTWVQIGAAIRLDHSSNTTIEDNKMDLYLAGIALFNESNGNIISNNTINSYLGVENSKNNVLIRNELFILILDNASVTVTRNDFENYSLETWLRAGQQMQCRNTEITLDNNYWGRQRWLPKIFLGTRTMSGKTRLTLVIDWHPARAPYDIPEMT
jgi:parallel beta-helix repeat protein